MKRLSVVAQTQLALPQKRLYYSYNSLHENAKTIHHLPLIPHIHFVVLTQQVGYGLNRKTLSYFSAISSALGAFMLRDTTHTVTY